MMKRKTWALLSLALLLGTIGAICLTVIVIDPFQVYHLATRYMPPIDNTTQVYANAGIARSYDYDSAVVGTSVTENFRPTRWTRCSAVDLSSCAPPPERPITTRC